MSWSRVQKPPVRTENGVVLPAEIEFGGPLPASETITFVRIGRFVHVSVYGFEPTSLLRVSASIALPAEHAMWFGAQVSRAGREAEQHGA